MGKAKKIFKANKAQALTNYKVSLNQFYSQQYQNQVNKDLKDANAKDQYKLNMRIRDQREEAKLQAFEKSENRFIDQLIFNEQAERIALEGEDRVFQERILDTAFQTDELNLQYQKQVIDSKYSYNEAERGIANAVTDFEIDKDLIKLDFDKQKSEVKSAGEKLDLREKENQADANTKQYENRLNRIRNEGQVRAAGRKGASAQRALQSVKALSGVNAALIADRLTKSEKAIDIERDILDAQYSKEGDGGFISRSKQLQTRRAKARKTQTTKSLTKRQDQVAKALGITREQFSMNRQQLGRSLLSAGEAYEQRLKKIKRDRFASDLNAYASRQLVPKVQPEIPKPFKTPVPVNIRPPRPVKPVKTPVAGQISANTNPVLQGISGVAGTVASVASVFGPAGAPVAGIAGAISFGASLLDRIF
jgi:hypothetical protein